MQKILLDCGTTYLKICEISLDGEIRKTEDYKVIELQQKINIIKKYLKDTTLNNNDKVVVAIATEMHGFILVNKDGYELCDYNSWTHECRREVLEEIRNKTSQVWINNTGMPLKAGIASTSLYEMLKNEQREYKKAIFLTLGDYIIYKLTGQVPDMHPTNAAATGLYDLVNNTWNYDYIEALGFDNIVFPRVEEGQCVHWNCGNTEFSFYEAIGDQQAALFGVGLLSDTDLSINMGTGSQISIISDKLILSEKFQTRPFFGNKYLLTIPHIPCGRALAVVYSFIEELICKYNGIDMADTEKIWSIIMESANENYNHASNPLNIDLGFFSNAVTDSNHGSICNIAEDNFNLYNFSLSIQETMAENYALMLQRLPINKKDISKIIFSGGVAMKNEYLRKRISEKIGDASVEVVSDETFKGLQKYLGILYNKGK